MICFEKVPDWLKAELREAVIFSSDKEPRQQGKENRRDMQNDSSKIKRIERRASIQSRAPQQNSPGNEDKIKIGRPPYSKSRKLTKHPPYLVLEEFYKTC